MDTMDRTSEVVQTPLEQERVLRIQDGRRGAESKEFSQG